MKAPNDPRFPNSIFEHYLPEVQWKDNPHKVLRWTNSEGVRMRPYDAYAKGDTYLSIVGEVDPKPFKISGGNSNSRNGARGAFYSHCSSSTACHAIMLVYAENKWHKVCAWWADPVYKNHDFKYTEVVPQQHHSFLDTQESFSADSYLPQFQALIEERIIEESEGQDEEIIFPRMRIVSRLESPISSIGGTSGTPSTYYLLYPEGDVDFLNDEFRTDVYVGEVNGSDVLVHKPDYSITLSHTTNRYGNYERDNQITGSAILHQLIYNTRS